MRSLPWRIRAATLISVGAIGVHDLRYLIAYRGSAAHELSVTGHGYLRVVTPLVAGVLVLVLASFAGRLLRGAGDEAPLPSTQRMWTFLSAVLVAIYCCQEWLEGVVASGHPGGVAGVMGGGGWVAVPLAIAIALLIALALRGAEAAIALAACPRRRSWLLPRPIVSLVAPSVWRPLVSGALARRLAPRGPPFASV
jgi:hypothetical protein